MKISLDISLFKGHNFGTEKVFDVEGFTKQPMEAFGMSVISFVHKYNEAMY